MATRPESKAFRGAPIMAGPSSRLVSSNGHIPRSPRMKQVTPAAIRGPASRGGGGRSERQEQDSPDSSENYPVAATNGSRFIPLSLNSPGRRGGGSAGNESPSNSSGGRNMHGFKKSFTIENCDERKAGEIELGDMRTIPLDGINMGDDRPSSPTRGRKKGYEDSVAARASSDARRIADRKNSWTLDDDTPLQRTFEGWIGILLFFIGLWTPFEIAYLDSSNVQVFYLNRMIDVSFIIDIFRQFVMPYVDRDTEQEVYDNRSIAKHYMKGWFLIDVFSVLPVDALFELIVGAPQGSLGTLRLIRIIRMFRLVKVVRLLRMSHVIRKYQAKLDLSYASFGLLSDLVLVLIVAHWCACSWNLVAVMTEDAATWSVVYGIEDSHIGTRYATSLYWAVMTLTTIGYGDIPVTNNNERVLATIIMLVGASIYAYVVGGICSTFSSMNKEIKDFQSAMDGLNNFMDAMNLPDGLRDKLRRYFNDCKAVHRQKYDQEALDLMSPCLRAIVADECYSAWIKRIVFLNLSKCCTDAHTQRDFITDISSNLRLAAYPAQESVIAYGELAKHMFIISSGLVGCKAKLLRKDDIFGEDMICGVTREYTATTLVFTQLMLLSRANVLAVIAAPKYRSIRKTIGQNAKWLALRHAFLELGRECKVLMAYRGKHIKMLWKNEFREALLCEFTNPNGSHGGYMEINRLDALRMVPKLKDVMAKVHKGRDCTLRVASREAAMLQESQSVGDMEVDELSRRLKHQVARRVDRSIKQSNEAIESKFDVMNKRIDGLGNQMSSLMKLLEERLPPPSLTV